MKRGSVPIESLKENLFVRTHLNQEHAQMLADLMKAGQKLPPILVTPSLVVVDGRHRLFGTKLNGGKGIEVEYLPEEPEPAALIAIALLANVGGALPPSHGDIMHAIKQMIESGTAQSAIGKLLQQKYPAAVVRRYMQDANSLLLKDRINRAMYAITNKGLTVGEAALANGLKPEQLRTVLGKNRKRTSTSTEIKGTMSTYFKSRSLKVASILKISIQRFEDGELSAKQVEEIIAHAVHLAHNSELSMRDWQKRFASAKRAASEVA